MSEQQPGNWTEQYEVAKEIVAEGDALQAQSEKLADRSGCLVAGGLGLMIVEGLAGLVAYGQYVDTEAGRAIAGVAAVAMIVTLVGSVGASRYYWWKKDRLAAEAQSKWLEGRAVADQALRRGEIQEQLRRSEEPPDATKN